MDSGVCIAIFAGEQGHINEVLTIDIHSLGNCFVSGGMGSIICVYVIVYVCVYLCMYTCWTRLASYDAVVHIADQGGALPAL